MTVLAIDPGLSGAVVRLSDGELLARRDFKKLADIAAAVALLAPGVDRAVIELVHAMPGQGVCSMFSFGRSTGVAYGALFSNLSGGDIVEVSPQKWQNYYRSRLNIPKGTLFDSREIATRLLPAHAHLFARKKDHNTADAALMALWHEEISKIC